MTNKKIIIPDTSVLIHDPNAIKSFEEHLVIILGAVLQELDNLKKGNDEIGFVARDIHRELDKLSEKEIPKPLKSGERATNPIQKVPAIFNGGVSLGEGLGKIEIRTMPLKLHNKLKNAYSSEIPDHQILSGVLQIMKEEEKSNNEVIFVSKDTNLRLKAKSLGIKTEDYKNDQVRNIDALHKGKGEIISEDLGTIIAELYQRGEAEIVYTNKETKEFMKNTLQPNMYFVFKTTKDDPETYVRVDSTMKKFIRLERKNVFKITPRNAEQVFALDAILDPDIKLVILNGVAGTGKSLLASAGGLHSFKEGVFETILLSAAMVTLSNRDNGALPGTAEEKARPFLQGIYDNLTVINGQIKDTPLKEAVVPKEKKSNKSKSPEKSKERSNSFISTSLENGGIVIQSLSYIRGRSINNSLLIVDECQNLTPHEIKTIITRAGENTKLIICGDIRQIDGRYLDVYSNGLSYAISKLSGKRPFFAHITLEKGERSALATAAAELL